MAKNVFVFDKNSLEFRIQLVSRNPHLINNTSLILRNLNYLYCKEKQCLLCIKFT